MIKRGARFAVERREQFLAPFRCCASQKARPLESRVTRIGLEESSKRAARVSFTVRLLLESAGFHGDNKGSSPCALCRTPRACGAQTPRGTQAPRGALFFRRRQKREYRRQNESRLLLLSPVFFFSPRYGLITPGSYSSLPACFVALNSVSLRRMASVTGR